MTEKITKTEKIASEEVQEPNVQTGRSNKGVLLAVLVAVLVFALATGVFVLSRQDSSKKVAIPQKLSATQQSDYLANSGDYGRAQKIIADEIIKTSNTTTKTGLYLQQVAIALNAKNYVDAKKYAGQAESLQPTAITASTLGFVAAQSGDKVAAKAYYEKAISRLDKNAESYNTSLQDYQTRLQELGQ